MSAQAHPAAHPAPNPAHHSHDGGHDYEGGAGHGTLRGYLTGFVLSVILTAIPFWLVMDGVISNASVTIFVVVALAVVQIVVHMIYFLHMNTHAEAGWTMISLMFTLVLVLITLIGSIWVMYHMNANMMPMTPHDIQVMQQNMQ